MTYIEEMQSRFCAGCASTLHVRRGGGVPSATAMQQAIHGPDGDIVVIPFQILRILQ
jgi:hypothetical protein